LDRVQKALFRTVAPKFAKFKNYPVVEKLYKTGITELEYLKHRTIHQDIYGLSLIHELHRKELHTVYPMLYKPTLKNSKN